MLTKHDLHASVIMSVGVIFEHLYEVYASDIEISEAIHKRQTFKKNLTFTKLTHTLIVFVPLLC